MILLTGASGFIGKHLISDLQEKFGKENLICFTSQPLPHAKYILHNQYNFNNDILKEKGYEEIEVVIHAGSFTPKSSNQQNQLDECLSIIANTRKLLNLKLPNLKRFILLSTLDVYRADHAINENSGVHPTTFYGQSKWYQEHLIANFCKANKIEYTIARLGHIYGPGEEAYQKLIPTVFAKILNKQPIEIFGDINDLRSFLYVKDATSVITNLVNTSKIPEIINIVSSKPETIKKIVEQIVSLTESNAEILINKQAQVQTRSLSFDNTLMREYLIGDETTLEDGLKMEWNYLKSKYA